ncbi:MAG: amidase [Phycisphaerales bacterium]
MNGDNHPRRLNRRSFLATAAAAGLIGASRPAVGQDADDDESENAGDDGEPTAESLRHAAKLIDLDLTEREREQALMLVLARRQRYRQRREQADLPNGVGQASAFRAYAWGEPRTPEADAMVRSPLTTDELPVSDADIAFAPVTRLSRWIESRAITSERLTRIYLDRLKKYGTQLECVVTLTEELALKQAKRADVEIAEGKHRGPLHGIPWGAKDLLDTAGIKTTYGAMPYKDRVADKDAAVVRKLEEAGAVLVAKLTLGALAYGDIWFGGTTKNPFNPQQGSSGSSAGSASATAAGLVGFSIGTETLGSIVSPCMRCGATGLRPTFGRVPRTDAMALCWSLDKIGPICRSVEDTVLVLDAIRGADEGDPGSVDRPLAFDAGADVSKLRVGYVPAWFQGRGAIDLDRQALEAMKATGATMVPVELPEMPYGVMMTILECEAASAFEEITFSNSDDTMQWQSPQAWPNTFRSSWFVPANELIQAERLRSQVCAMMRTAMNDFDVLITPSFAGSILLITNYTGHPALVLRTGFRSNNRPHGITLVGHLFDEGRLASAGLAIERAMGVAEMRPDGF